MSFKIIFSFFLLVFLIGCKQLEEPQKKIIKTEPEIIIKKEEVTTKPTDEIEEDNSKYIFNREYTNQGFALIYSEVLFNEKKISKKIDNRGLYIFHKKIRKNSFKRRKVVKRKIKSGKKISKKETKNENSSTSELIFKTKPDWIKSGLQIKPNNKKNIMNQLKITMHFGKKREKELLGLNLTKK